MKEKYSCQRSESNSIYNQISIDSKNPISRPIVEQKAKLIELEKTETGNVCVDLLINIQIKYVNNHFQ